MPAHTAASPGGDQPPSRLRRGRTHLGDMLDPFRRATLEGEHTGREDFARLADVDKGCFDDLPSRVAGDTKPVDVGLDAAVELGEVLE